VDEPVTYGTAQALVDQPVQGWWGPVVRAGGIAYAAYVVHVDWDDQHEYLPPPVLEARVDAAWITCLPEGVSGGNYGDDRRYAGMCQVRTPENAEEYRLIFPPLRRWEASQAERPSWTVGNNSEVNAGSMLQGSRLSRASPASSKALVALRWTISER
jgi:hypothetical protein